MPPIPTRFATPGAGPGPGTEEVTDRATSVLSNGAGWELMTTPLTAVALKFNRLARLAGGTGGQNVVRIP